MREDEEQFLNEVIRNSLQFQKERDEAIADSGLMLLIGLGIGLTTGILLTNMFY